MTEDQEKGSESFKSRKQIKELRSQKNRRWRKLARADLKALAADSDGLDLLAKAIQAVLRQSQTDKKPKDAKSKRRR